MDTSNFGFDPTKFTNAPLQTEGWIRFTDPPDKVFARLAHHEGLTEWVPLLKKVTVSHPQPLWRKRLRRNRLRAARAPSAQRVRWFFKAD